MGLQNLHIVVASVLFAILLLPFLLLRYGKKARSKTVKAYMAMAARQPTHRQL
jgi:hypothetical protein